MNFTKSTNLFLKFFYRLGQSANLTHDCLKYNFCLFFCYAVLMVMQTIMVYYMSITYAVDTTSGYYIQIYTRADIFCTYIFSLCEIARGSWVFMQCVFQKHLVYDIINTYRNMESFFVIHLQYRIVYVAFKKQYIRQKRQFWSIRLYST